MERQKTGVFLCGKVGDRPERALRSKYVYLSLSVAVTNALGGIERACFVFRNRIDDAVNAILRVACGFGIALPGPVIARFIEGKPIAFNVAGTDEFGGRSRLGAVRRRVSMFEP